MQCILWDEELLAFAISAWLLQPHLPLLLFGDEAQYGAGVVVVRAPGNNEEAGGCARVDAQSLAVMHRRLCPAQRGVSVDSLSV